MRGKRVLRKGDQHEGRRKVGEGWEGRRERGIRGVKTRGAS